MAAAAQEAYETLMHTRDGQLCDVIIDKARYSDGSHKTMWNLIVKKGIPPTRHIRYCCSELKEQGGKHRIKVTGVRWAESTNRAESSDLVKIMGIDINHIEIESSVNLKQYRNLLMKSVQNTALPNRAVLL